MGPRTSVRGEGRTNCETWRSLREVTPSITLSRYVYILFFRGAQEYTPDPDWMKP